MMGSLKSYFWLLLLLLSRSTADEALRLALWERGLNEVPRCENQDVCRSVAAEFPKVRGGATAAVDLDALIVELGDEFAAALAVNEAEHKRDCEASCADFYCGPGASTVELKPLREISMGSVPPEDFASEFRHPLDLIKVTKEPFFDEAEARAVLKKARELDGVDQNEYTSGKYKLGGNWIQKLPETKIWFNNFLEQKLFPNMAASFPEIITNASTLRAHSVALLKYNTSHPRTDIHIDNGILALTLAVSPQKDYVGGGTFFEHLGANQLVTMDTGYATWRPGSVRHGGHRVTSGERFIVGAFFLLEDRVEHVRRLKNRGSDLRGRGDIDGAVQHFEWALKINPKCATCLKDASEALALKPGQGDLEKAEEYLRRALDLLPHDSDALFSLGVLLSKKGDNQGSLDAYKRSAAINADDAELLYNLGIKLSEVGGASSKEAEVDAYRQCLEVDPKFSKARLNLGATLADMNDLAGAEAEWLKAVQDPTTMMNALQNLGILYEQQAQPVLADVRMASTKADAVELAKKANAVMVNAENIWRKVIDAGAGLENLDAFKARLLKVLTLRGRLVAIYDIPEAIKPLKEAAGIAPTDASIWQALLQASKLINDSVLGQEATSRLQDLQKGQSSPGPSPWKT